MESKNETSSVILKLMGLDKVPSEHHPVRNRPRVLSEDYLQKVASIGLRKKRSSHQRRSFGTSTGENKESNNVFKVVKTVSSDANHNESQIVVHGEAGLYEISRLSKSQLDPKDVTLDSRIVVSKVNRGNEENGEFKRNIRCKVGLSYSFARKVPMTKPFADNCGTMTKDDLFQKYWGLSKNASENWSNQNSKNRNINQKDCSEDMNLKASSEKSPSFSSYFNRNDSNHTENCTDLHKLKKRCYGNDLFEKEHTLSQLSCSDSQILQQTSLTNEDVNNDKHEDSSMSKKVAMSLDSSIEILVSESKIKVVGCSNNNPTMEQSESTVSVIMWGDSDSSSYASKQQV
jgi:hypothetical protein